MTTTTGTLSVGTYTITGTTSDPSGDVETFTLTVTAATITQTGTTAGSSTVTGSSAFRHQLTVTGHNGAVTYARTSASDHLKISSSGMITTTGTLAARTYRITGTTRDPNGDHGTFRLTLTVRRG
jgi:hypothetical protein